MATCSRAASPVDIEGGISESAVRLDHLFLQGRTPVRCGESGSVIAGGRVTRSSQACLVHPCLASRSFVSLDTPPGRLRAPSTKMAQQPIRVLNGAEQGNHDLLDRTEDGSTGVVNWIEAVKYLARPRLTPSRCPDLSSLLALHRTPVVALSLRRRASFPLFPSRSIRMQSQGGSVVTLPQPSPCRLVRSS